jgi:hypothetical protein
MRRVRIIGLCVIAALAICAVAVSSASAAAPEFGRCIKKSKAEGSGYSNAGCTTSAESGAKYEWTNSLSKAKFESKGRFVETTKLKRCLIWQEEVRAGNLAHAAALLAGWGYTEAECIETIEKGEGKEEAVLETVHGSKVECSGVSATGEYTSPKTVSVNSTFTGCTTTEFEQEVTCQSAGASSGEVKIKPLDGELNIIKKESLPTSNTVGISLAAASGTVITEFECGPFFPGTLNIYAKLVTTGSVIHQVTANKMLLEENEKFVQSKGLQKPENFDGGEKDVLESSLDGGEPVQAGESLLTRLYNEEKIEVNTVV